MKLKGLKIGFALTGSHCTLAQAIEALKQLVSEGADITPIISYAVNSMETRYGNPHHWNTALRDITGKEPLRTIPEVEPIGPQRLIDCLVIAPCTGNTLAKLACGIADTPVLMAAKAHLRNLLPLVIAVSTNDGLGSSAKNIGALLASKNVFLVPFGQDSPSKKANSLVAHMEMIPEVILAACQGKQIQPILVEFKADS